MDDDPLIRALLATTLEQDGYTVLTAANGADALDLIGRGGYRPSVILLDMDMPVLDGPGFIRAYRQLRHPHARIVLISAALGLTAVATELAVDEAVGKPFDLDAISDTVRQHTHAA